MPGANGNTPKAFNAGVWKDWNAVQGNLTGTWRLASDVFIRRNDVWTKVWVRLTAPTSGSTSLSDVTATISWTAGVGQEGFKLYRNGVFVKNVAANATNTTDPLPTLNDVYTYTVSAYAGPTETEQISCGAGVSRGVDAPTNSTATILTDWGYVNNDWNGSAIYFTISCTGSIQTGFQYSLDNGASWSGGSPSNSANVWFNENTEVNVRWRVWRNYNSVFYYSSASTSVVNIKTGRPLKRNPAENVNYNKTAQGVTTVGETVDFGAFGVVVDSYQFRSVDAVGSSLLANSTRRVTFRRPSGAGGDIVIPYGSSPTSGTSDSGGTYQQGPFTNYVAGFYGLSTIGTGWPGSGEPYVTYTLRFTVRSIAQTAIPYLIT
jgi:hypothetical protein